MIFRRSGTGSAAAALGAPGLAGPYGPARGNKSHTALDTMSSKRSGGRISVIGSHRVAAVSWKGAACYGVHFGRSAAAYHVPPFLDAGDSLELRSLGSSFA